MSDVFAEKIISDYMSAGNSIIDPFMGVGTTGIIANKLDIDFTGIELSKEYLDVAKDRLQKEL